MNSYTRLSLAEEFRLAIIDHCRRKLHGVFLEGEAREKKAYGLLGGISSESSARVTDCRPLLKNARHLEPFKSIMDRSMEAFAVPSVTPLDKRGWVAEPRELLDILKFFRQQGRKLVGTYHMHRVSWPHDPLRDKPTVLDTELGAGTGLVMLIISMVTPERPILRAFYEGNPEAELIIAP